MNEEIRKRIVRHVPRLLSFFRNELEIQTTREQMERALVSMVEHTFEEFVEDLEETLFDPRSAAHRALRNELPTGTVFNGYREFSLEKFSAVLLFFIVRAGVKMMTRTKLNKLAFYSDFYHHRATGRSITGTTYRHLPYGPVVDGCEEILAFLDEHDVITIESVPTRHGLREVIRAIGDVPAVLSDSERLTLERIATAFGSMTAEELSDFSHLERAWKDTRTGEEIAYGYSMFLKDLS